MKRLTLTLLVIIGTLVFTSSCRERTTEEKIEDGIEEVGDGIEEAGDELEDATDQ